MTQVTPRTCDTSDMLIPHGMFRAVFGGAGDIVRGLHPDETARAGAVHAYVDNALRFLDAHHGAEDALLWPLLRERCADAGGLLDRMEGEHEVIHGRRADAAGALAAWSATPAVATADDLAAAIAALHADMDHHFGEEEREILPLAGVNVTQDEWGSLPGHAMSHFTGDRIWLVLGLIFEQMTPEQVATTLHHVPAPVVEMWRTTGEAAYTAMMAEVRGG